MPRFLLGLTLLTTSCTSVYSEVRDRTDCTDYLADLAARDGEGACPRSDQSLVAARTTGHPLMICRCIRAPLDCESPSSSP